MPDGYEPRTPRGREAPKRPRPADERPPARRVPSVESTDPYDQPYDSAADRYERYDESYDTGRDRADEQPQRPGGMGKRLKEWLGFGHTDPDPPSTLRPGGGSSYAPLPEVDEYGDPDAPPAAADQRTPRRRSPGLLSDAPDASDAAAAPVIPPQPTEPPPRRPAKAGRWEDVMLGSGPAAGTPASDSMPAETLTPEHYQRGDAIAASEYPQADPLDLVDPLHPDDPSSEVREEEDDDVVSSSVTVVRVGAVEQVDETDQTDETEETGTAEEFEEPEQYDDEPEDVTDTTEEEEEEDSSSHVAVMPIPDGPQPRRMLRMMPTPVLADGGGLVVDGGRIGKTVVRSAGVRGGLHQHQGLPRQNYFAVGPDPSGQWTITVLGDGVDDTYAPELAAQVAVRSAYRAVAQMLTDEKHEDWDWPSLFAAVDAELEDRLADMADRAVELNRPAPSTRLAVVVTSTNPERDDRVDIAVLGDSTVLRLAEGGWRAPLGIHSPAEDDLPAVLPGHIPADLRICRTTWRSTDVLVLMTGSFAEALGEAAGGLAPRLAEEWRRPPELLQFLADLDTGLGQRTGDGATVALWPHN